MSVKPVEKQDIPMLVLYAVALGLGVVSLVLTFVGEGNTDTILTLIGIGVFCLAVAGINTLQKSS